MARLAACANGNLTSSSTWSLIDSTSYLNSETGSETVTTAYSGTRSSTFAPGAITIDGIGVKLATRTGTTGTLSVSLYNDSLASDVSGTEVTINCSDLPNAASATSNGGWIFFAFSAPVLLLTATNYRVQAKTSNATQVALFRDGTGDNICRYLRTTTTQAPAAGDDMIITGEWTAAATVTSRTVTMDSTAATDYGAGSTSLITPALSICQQGALTYGTTAATNYILRLSGALVVYAEGTINIGTTGTPIPRDSTAVLEFDCAADGDFGGVSRAGSSGTNIQGLSRTSGKNVSWCALNTDESAGQTTLGVDTDTGWLSGDEIVVASTTTTAAQSELRTLSGDAGASSMTVSSGLTNAHSGTSPTQAEVILLTRNVKIRSVSSTAMAYWYFGTTAVADLDWAEFRYIGTITSGKRGIESDITTGSLNINHCSIYDCEGTALLFGSTNSSNHTVSDLVIYNTATPFAHSGTSLSSTNSFTNVFSITSSSGFSLTGGGFSVVNNLHVVGSAGNPTFAGTYSNSVTFSNVNIHSGAQMTTNTILGNKGTLSNWQIWRNTTYGWTINGTLTNLNIEGLVMFGSPSGSLSLSSAIFGLYIKDFVSSGDTSFASTNGVNIANNMANVVFDSPDFSTVTGIKTAHTNDITVAASVTTASVNVLLRNAKLGASTEISGQTNLTTYYDDPISGSVRVQRKDQTDDSHVIWLSNGTIINDTAIYNTAAPSVRMTPTSSTIKLKSGYLTARVSDGQTCTPTVYVRESEAGDGAAYNGNRIRLILKRNDALGISSDTVIDTATASSDGSWEALTGTTSTVIDDGVLEFYLDCDGTTGWVNYDDFSATVA